MRYVSPVNPRGTPPPPPPRPRSDDVIEQLMFDMDQASRLGLSLRLGDLRVYGSDGNRSAFEAMVEAGGQIQAMGLHVLNTGLMIGSFIPGPIGVLSNGISMMMALANGDEGTALEMGIGMVARMNPCGRALLLRGIIRAAKVVDVKINLDRAHTAWQKGDYLTAGTSLLGAVSSTATFLNACFAAGTKLLTKRGWLPIEQLVVGDGAQAQHGYERMLPATPVTRIRDEGECFSQG